MACRIGEEKVLCTVVEGSVPAKDDQPTHKTYEFSVRSDTPCECEVFPTYLPNLDQSFAEKNFFFSNPIVTLFKTMELQTLGSARDDQPTHKTYEYSVLVTILAPLPSRVSRIKG